MAHPQTENTYTDDPKNLSCSSKRKVSVTHVMVSGSLQYSARVGTLKGDLSEPAGYICNCCVERRPFHITFSSNVSLNASLHMSMSSVSGHYQETLMTVEGVVVGELDDRQVSFKTTKLVHPLYIYHDNKCYSLDRNREEKETIRKACFFKYM